MRELEVIPVLLDCCNIDARNPRILLKYYEKYQINACFIFRIMVH